MSWHSDNALKRILNVFKRSKEKVYKEDIAALQLLNDELVNSQEKYVNDNQLYAKLLCCILKNNLDNYGNMKIAIAKSKDILNTPLGNHIEFLRMKLNEIDTRDYLESLNIDLNNYSDSQDLEINKILLDNQKEVKEKLSKFWNYEKIEKSFYNTANEFLKDVTNYN